MLGLKVQVPFSDSGVPMDGIVSGIRWTKKKKPILDEDVVEVSPKESANAECRYDIFFPDCLESFERHGSHLEWTVDAIKECRWNYEWFHELEKLKGTEQYNDYDVGDSFKLLDGGIRHEAAWWKDFRAKVCPALDSAAKDRFTREAERRIIELLQVMDMNHTQDRPYDIKEAPSKAGNGDIKKRTLTFGVVGMGNKQSISKATTKAKDSDGALEQMMYALNVLGALCLPPDLPYTSVYVNLNNKYEMHVSLLAQVTAHFHCTNSYLKRHNRLLVISLITIFLE